MGDTIWNHKKQEEGFEQQPTKKNQSPGEFGGDLGGDNFKNIELLEVVYHAPPETISTSIPSTTYDNSSSIGDRVGQQSPDNGNIQEGFSGGGGDKSTQQYLSEAITMILFPFQLITYLDPTALTNTPLVNNQIRSMASKSYANEWFKVASDSSKKLQKMQEDVLNGDISGNSFAAFATPDVSSNYSSWSSFGSSSSSSSSSGITGAGSFNTPETEEKCMPQRNPLTAADKAFAQDSQLIKDYIFKTILLFLCFITVYNWAYLLLESEPNEGSILTKNKTMLKKSDEKQSASDPMTKFMNYMEDDVIPVVGFPFKYSVSTLGTLRDLILQDMPRKLNEWTTTIDKKTWFILIFWMTFMLSEVMIKDYKYYMSSITQFKSNAVISFLYIYFILLYLISFKTEFFDYYPRLTNWPGIIMTIIINFILIFCIMFNTYITMFFTIIGFYAINFFGTWILPPNNWFAAKDAVNSDLNNENSEKQSDGVFVKVLKSIAKYVWDNFYSVTLFLWIARVFHVFSKHLEHPFLRENMFLVLTIAFITVGVTKLAGEAFKLFGKSSGGEGGTDVHRGVQIQQESSIMGTVGKLFVFLFYMVIIDLILRSS